MLTKYAKKFVETHACVEMAAQEENPVSTHRETQLLNYSTTDSIRSSLMEDESPAPCRSIGLDQKVDGWREQIQISTPLSELNQCPNFLQL